MKPGPYYKPARAAFLLLLLFPLNALRETLADELPYLRGPLIRLIGERATLVLALVLLALLLIVLARRPARIYAGAMTGLLIVSFCSSDARPGLLDRSHLRTCCRAAVR